MDKISDKEIFIKIWTSPREIFRYVNQLKYDKHLYLLLFLAGISRAFDRAVGRDMGDNMSIWAIMSFCIILGGLLGWISYYIYAALVSWTGNWLKGKGDTKSLLRVFSYALLPLIASMLFLIPQILIYGNEIFKSDGDIISAGFLSNILVYGSVILEIGLAIWSLVLFVVAISEVQQFSIGRSIVNLFLPVLIFVVPIFLILFISGNFN